MKIQRTMIALFAFHSVLFTGIQVAMACTPVAYLFPHAEVNAKLIQTYPFTPTLSYPGQAHSALYIQMMGQFQPTQSYCPVARIYALDPIKSFNPAGAPVKATSNPYWTAAPFAQNIMALNPIITIGDTNLDEFLNNDNIATTFLDDIKTNVNDQKSVAIFWTGAGMCRVGDVLGPGLPGFSCVGTDIPPMNSVFIFNYDVLGMTFSSVTTTFEQCFNWDNSTKLFSTSQYFCSTSADLNLFIDVSKFAKNLSQIAGRICNTSPPDPACVF